jgi:hypothetical protein
VACGILECAHFIILVCSTCAHYAIVGAYKNDIKQLTILSTFAFTFTIWGFIPGVLHMARKGMAWQVKERQVMACHGMERKGMARQGMAWHGMIWKGKERHGLAMQGKA